ncbi:DUF1064 domain-containing protein [Thiohalorhabdus sp.]|uniref:DUF1064 domain-containing protein n=1 Tax=Thiohalorhabdus sp. TaxID=3094134 RepID=UPI002FC33C92
MRYKQRGHKYKARKVWACGNCQVPHPKDGSCRRCGCTLIKFDSKAEYEHWVELLLLERAGRISGLTLQPAFPIQINGEKVGTYYGDFQYRDSEGQIRVEDVKGKDTALSRFKRRCVKAQYGVQVEIIQA